MKITDLRIGNWVTIGECKRLIKWSVSYFAHMHNNSSPFEKQFAPIPLTAELLGQIGFKRSLTYLEGDSNEIILPHTDISFNLDMGEVRFASGNAAVDVDYLHELQNLYFALMKEELPINIPQPA